MLILGGVFLFLLLSLSTWPIGRIQSQKQALDPSWLMTEKGTEAHSTAHSTLSLQVSGDEDLKAKGASLL